MKQNIHLYPKVLLESTSPWVLFLLMNKHNQTPVRSLSKVNITVTEGMMINNIRWGFIQKITSDHFHIYDNDNHFELMKISEWVLSLLFNTVNKNPKLRIMKIDLV
jgi:hypothetical protein